MKVFLPGEGFANYRKALTALGAEPMSSGPEDCGGLLLPGGWDVHPRHYGESVAGSQGIDEERDAREFEAISFFMDRQRPILGICRGIQILNVALGGSLYQDIPGHQATAEGDSYHETATKDPVLRSLYGERFTVNSSHHQAVKRLGDGLEAVQWALDGTVEAVRHARAPVFGVQWHPERQRRPVDGWLLLARWLLEL